MQNTSRIQQIDWQIAALDQQIKSAESSKTTGIILMCVSLVIIWPLLIAGGYMFFNANSKINNLNSQKQMLLLERRSLSGDQPNNSPFPFV